MGRRQIIPQYFCKCGTEIFRKIVVSNDRLYLGNIPKYCKVCQKERRRQYHNTYRKHKYHSDPAYRAKCLNRSKLNASNFTVKQRAQQYHKDYYLRPENKEKILAQSMEYYHSHPEFRAKRIAQMKAWRERQKQFKLQIEQPKGTSET